MAGPGAGGQCTLRTHRPRTRARGSYGCRRCPAVRWCAASMASMILAAASRRRRSLGVSGSSIAARVATRRSRPARRSDSRRGALARDVARSAGRPGRGAARRGRRRPCRRRGGSWSAASRPRSPASDADRPRAAEDEDRQRRQPRRRTRRSRGPPARADEAGGARRNGVGPPIRHRSTGTGLTTSRILVAATNDRRDPKSGVTVNSTADACRSHRRGQRRRRRPRRATARRGPDTGRRPRSGRRLGDHAVALPLRPRGDRRAARRRPGARRLRGDGARATSIGCANASTDDPALATAFSPTGSRPCISRRSSARPRRRAS